MCAKQFLIHIVALITLNGYRGETRDNIVTVRINTADYVAETNEDFLSTALAPKMMRDHFKEFNFTSTKIMTLAKALSPAYMRYSGTEVDRLIYVGNNKVIADISISGIPFPIGGLNMTWNEWQTVNEFAVKVGWKVVFGLNAQIRFQQTKNNSVWNPVNTLKLLNNTIQHSWARNVHFELGNEPDIYFAKRNFQHVTPEQLASDFCHLRSILDSYENPFADSLLIGPDVTQSGPGYLQRFLNSSIGCISATSWHHYYGKGEELNHPDNYTDPVILDRYLNSVNIFKDTIKRSRQSKIKVWQGETASTVSPPDSNIDETYVATFMLLDKLGLSARHGIDVVIKQAFYSFWFSLINDKYTPTPNYWVALLYKRLVGKRVLDVEILSTNGITNRQTRAYAHCSSKRSGYPDGSIVIYVMNLNESSIRINLPGASLFNVYQYLITAMNNDVLSTSIKINDKKVQLTDDDRLPLINSKLISIGSDILMTPKSMAFYILSNANITFCMT